MITIKFESHQRLISPRQHTPSPSASLPNTHVFSHADEELLSILRGKLAREQLTADVDALVAASGVLGRKRGTDAHFGNGGAVANLLSEAKLRKERRRGSDGSMASRQGLLRDRLPSPPFSYVDRPPYRQMPPL